MKREIVCIECPVGCTVEVETEGKEGKVLSVRGNGCPRGKAYAESEVVCPRRVLTTTVRAASGEMIPVKSSAPVKKELLMEHMARANAVHPVLPVRIGDAVLREIEDGIDLVATDNVPAQGRRDG